MRQLIILCSILSLLKVTTACGQKKDSVNHDELVCYFEPQPTFPGGFEALRTFIKNNLKYPRGTSYVGNVYVGFIITEDGSPIDFKVIKGLCDACDKNAIEALEKMPKWIPAQVNGKPTRTRMVIPIKYEL